MKKNILSKILKKKFSVAVIGLGYIGLPLAMASAKSKIKTYGYDNDKEKIRLLYKNKSYINTISSKELKKSIKNFFFPLSDFKNISNQDIIVICVPTPLGKKNIPNLKYVTDVIKNIKNYIRKGQIIILECTTYPGTTEEYFLPIFKKNKLTVGKNIFLGYSPEREDPGNNKFSVLKKNIPKVVSGYTKNCLDLVESFYKNISNKVFRVKSIRTAEFTKLLENIYRSVNIGLINELAEVCRKMNIDIHESINAAKTKPFGFNAFFPGPGVGGHCIPVDPLYLTWKAKKYGVDTKFIKLAAKINDNRPHDISSKILKILSKINKKTSIKEILLLGISYKKNSDDIRESPCLKIANNLFKHYLNKLKVCDPNLNFKKSDQIKHLNSIKLRDLYKSKDLKKFDVLIILNAHDAFDLKKIVNRSKVVIDLVNSCNNISHKNIIKI